MKPFLPPTVVVYFLLLASDLAAQAPQSFKYQSIARDAFGAPMANKEITLRISIHDSDATGSVVYAETHAASTNAFGLFTVSIGEGTVVSGSFSTIDWGAAAKFIETEADFSGGSTFVSMGTSQLLSVPYALYAQSGPTSSAGNAWGLTGNSGTSETTDFIGTTDNKSINFRVNNEKAGRIDVAGPVFLGYWAGKNNTDLYSTGIGYQSLYFNTTGLANTAIGYNSLWMNTTGTHNTASGASALRSNTTGHYNTAHGYSALFSNTTGQSNTAMGWSALGLSTTGNRNTSVGVESMHYNSTGNFNSAYGYSTLYYNLGGTNNTAIGSNALYTNNTGSGNTACGVEALYGNANGSNNTAVGKGAFLSGTSFSNSTAVGFNAQVTASNMIRLGDANVTSINGAVGFTVVSDGRFKKDIRENVAGLPFIMKLRPVTYHLDMDKMAVFTKTPEHLRTKASEDEKEKVLQTGFIAQEVENAARELGFDFSGVDKPQNESAYYGLRYAEFTVPLVKAVQEQQKMIENLKEEIETLKGMVNDKQSNVDRLKKEVGLLKTDQETRLKKLEEVLAVSSKK